ncbi:MAG: 30S ribosomal protein S1 [Acidimicrobiales bacterium]|nr:MAG: S1 RNA-binding domain-containing protein [Actinomycetota bacterium]MBV6508712.1 30S ribosomal protein S1 [Acidimicrobiales bacterium]RIK08144.1 MAG: hypothetical protein DCC48_01855 [Acidobacteriota bacterium]
MSQDAAPSAGGSAPASNAGDELRREGGRIFGVTVTGVSPKELDVELDDGRAGVINVHDFGPRDTDLGREVKIGDHLDAAVLLREDRRGRITLSKVWADKQRAWREAEQAMSDRATVTAKVTKVVRGGLVVDLGVRAFLPASLVDEDPIEDLERFVGKTVDVQVVEVDENADRLVVSRRACLRQERRAREKEALRSLEEGRLVTGVVKSIVDYGAFIDVGGITGLVHRSELSWSRVTAVEDVVEVGDEIEVVVTDINASKRRVNLSVRQTTEDPLEHIATGEVVGGVVSRLAEFGAFVRIGPGEGIEGLVHRSELAEYVVHRPEEVVTPGEEVMVRVLAVDKRRRRVDLSIRQAVF